MTFKIHATRGLVKDVVGFNHSQFKCQWAFVKVGFGKSPDIVRIDIDTIEELVALSECCELVVNGDSIELYNDYRE